MAAPGFAPLARAPKVKGASLRRLLVKSVGFACVVSVALMGDVASAQPATSVGSAVSAPSAVGTSSCEFGELSSATVGTGASQRTTTLTRDALGRLASWTADGTTTTAGYLGAADIPVSLTSGTQVTQLVRDSAGTLISAKQGTAVSHAVQNLHGDLVAWRSGAGTGALVTSTLFDAFGVPSTTDGSGAGPGKLLGLGFESHLTNPVTGLVDLGARSYDPGTGRFTAQDDVVGDLTSPVSLNRYTYANADPLNFIDPTGHWPDWLDAAIDWGKEALSSAVEWGASTAKEIAEKAAPVLKAVGAVLDPVLKKGASLADSFGRKVGEAAGAAYSWMKEHPHITSFVVGTVATGVCTTVTLGVAAPLCVALGGAASGIVENQLDPNADHSAQGVLHDAVLGGIFGLAGGAVGKYVLGPLARMAAPYVVPAAQALGRVTGRAVSGAAPGASRLIIAPLKRAYQATKGLITKSESPPSAETAEAGAARACEGGLCGIPGKTCFVAGTLIRTERGDIPIEEVKVGDKAWSRNIATGEDELQPVVDTYVRLAESLLKLNVAGAVLTTTADHPFLVKDRGWVKAGDLTAGDVLVTPTGTTVLAGVKRVAKGATVYNFQVDINHDYYALAGTTPILVHNADYSFIPRMESAGDLAKYTQSQTTRDAFSHYEFMSNEDLLASINNATAGGGITSRVAGRSLTDIIDGMNYFGGSLMGGSTPRRRFRCGVSGRS